MQNDTAFIDGKMRNLYHPENRKGINKEANYFFENFHRRFNYLLIKEMMEVLDVDSLKSKSYNELFCERLKNDRFYNNFRLLLPADTCATVFTKDEMMLVASRFFYCDTVLKKGGKIGIGWHVCVGVNGLSELKNKADLTSLEAFAFEVLNSAMAKHKKPLFYKNFIQYVGEVNKREKTSYTDDKTHLEKVRQQCYKLMQNDKALQQILLEYFEKKKRSFGFSIQ
ncbi:MAG: hypothetical protein H7Y86_16780 [Rhizobacter sp.]|nr:hypothetical protein [Ferruginibacter sp.]